MPTNYNTYELSDEELSRLSDDLGKTLEEENLDVGEDLDGFDELDVEDLLITPVTSSSETKSAETITEKLEPKTATDEDIELLKQLGIDSTNITDWLAGDMGQGKDITNEEVSKLAKHFNTSTKDIEQIISYYRGTLEDNEKRSLMDKFQNKLDYVSGHVAYAVGDLPQWAAKKAESFINENAEKKWDVVRELTERRRSKAGMLSPTMLAPAGVAKKGITGLINMAAKTRGPAILKTAGMMSAVGSVYGAAASKRGEELSGMAIGAAASPVLGIAIPGLVKGISKLMIAPILNKAMQQDTIARLSDTVIRRLGKREYAEDVIYDMARGRQVKDLDVDKIKSQLRIKDKQIKQVMEELGTDSEERAIREIVGDTARREAIQFSAEYLPQMARINEAVSKGGMDIQKAIDDREVDVLEVFIKDLKLPKHSEEEILSVLGTFLDDANMAHLLERIGTVLRKQGRERDLVKDLSGLYKHLDEAERVEGRNLRTLWNQFRFGTEANKEVARLNNEMGRDVVRFGNKRGVLQTIGDFMSAAPHTLDRIDDRYGSDLGYWNLKLNNGLQVAQNDAEMLVEKYHKDYVKQFRRILKGKKGWDAKTFSRYMNNVEKWEDKVPGYYRDLRKIHNEKYKNLRKEMADRGNEIPELENYIPGRLKPRDKIRTIMWDGLDESRGKFSAKDLDSKSVFKKLQSSDTDFREYVGSAMTLGNSTKRPKTFTELETLVNQIQNDPDLSQVIARVNSANFRKTGRIPELIRETDPSELMLRWIQENTRFIHTRDPMREMLKWVKPLEKMGARSDADYLKFMLNKAAGYNKGWWEKQITDKAGRRYNDYVDSITKPGTVREMIKKAPIGVGHFFNTAYGALLSSPKSAMRNMEQPIVLTSEEIDTVYGKELYLRSIIPSLYESGSDSVKRVLDRIKLAGSKKSVERANGIIARMEESGRLPKTIRLESVDVGKPETKTGDMIEFVNRALLAPFTYADKSNRVTTVIMAENLVRDAAKGRKEALDYLTKNITSPSVLAKMKRNVNAKNWKEATEDLTDHLLQKTQFVYNKNNQSRFANTVGPVVSMFTRWPTEIIGDVLTKGAMGQSDKAVQKYLGPLAYLYTLDKIIENSEKTFGNMEDSVFPGRGGFVSHAPILNLKLFTLNEHGGIDITATPHVKAATSLIYALLGNDAATTRFLRDDLPTYIGIRAASNIMDNYPKMAGYDAYGVKEGYNKKAKEWSKYIKKKRPRLDDIMEDILKGKWK